MFGFGFICLLAFCRGEKKRGRDLNNSVNVYLFQFQIGRPKGKNLTSLQTELSRKESTKTPILLTGQPTAFGCENKGCLPPTLLGSSLMHGRALGEMLGGTCLGAWSTSLSSSAHDTHVNSQR